jgi:ABC-type phosphate transport system auxiliary subunit
VNRLIQNQIDDKLVEFEGDEREQRPQKEMNSVTQFNKKVQSLHKEYMETLAQTLESQRNFFE